MGKTFSGGIGQAVAVILLLSGVGLTLWNEYRTIRVSLMLNNAEKNIIEVDPSVSDKAAYEGELVHLTGVTQSAGPIRDMEMGVEADALLLKREVNYYQLAEYRDNETEEVTYHEDWTDRPLSSQEYYKAARRDANFVYVRLADRKDTCSTVTVRGYRLPKNLIGWARDYTTDMHITVPEKNMAELRAQARSATADVSDIPVHIFGNVIYVGPNPSKPQIGDVRIEYSMVPHGTVSVLGKAQGDEIVQYGSGREYHIFSIMEGEHSAGEMLDEERENNRGGGFLVLIVGLILTALGLAGSWDLIKSLFRR